MAGSIFDEDEEAVILFDRLSAIAARIEWLTGWRPRFQDDDLGAHVAAPSDQVTRLFAEWQDLKPRHQARLREIDHKRLSRFQRQEFDSEDEAQAAQLWWLSRY